MKIKLVNRYLKILFSYYIGKPFFKPDTISMIVSKNCNLKCCMCDFWKDQKNVEHDPLTLDDYIRIFRQFKDYGVNAVQFTGGETLLFKDIFTILKEAKSIGLKTMMVTNGTLIDDEKAEKIAKYVDTLYISVDGPTSEIQDRVRGVEGTFQKIVDGVGRLVSARLNRQGNEKGQIIFVSTMSPESFHDPEEMDALAKRLKIDRVIYNSASTVQYAHTTLLNTFGDENNEGVFERYNLMVDKILELMEKPGSLIKPNPFYLEFSREFVKGNKKYYHIPCYGGAYNGALVGLDGEVYPCCAWNKPLGNLKSTSFMEIWELKETQQIRKMIKAGKCPVCFHHTRSFDFIVRSPLLLNNFPKLYKYFRSLGSF